MRRLIPIAVVAVVVVLAVWLTTWTFAQARANDYMMVGVVVAEENVALEADESQAGGGDTVTISRVLAPDDSWLVVHLDEDGKPGMRVGLAPVTAGESTDVVVTLDEDAAMADSLIVALHADRGERGVLEFSMDHFMKSPDKPYFVGFHEVAVVVQR